MGRRGPIEIASVLADFMQQRPAHVQPLAVLIGRRGQRAGGIAVRVRIAVKPIRIAGGAEEARVLAGTLGAYRRNRFRNHHPRRHARIGPAGTAPPPRRVGRSSRLIVTICGATRVIGLPIIIQYCAAG